MNKLQGGLVGLVVVLTIVSFALLMVIVTRTDDKNEQVLMIYLTKSFVLSIGSEILMD